jgi:hypothetical protein
MQSLYGYQGKVDTANIGAGSREKVAGINAKNRIDVENLKSDSAENVAQIAAGARYYAANKGFDAAQAKIAAARDIANNRDLTANRRIDAAIQMKHDELDVATRQGDANRQAAASRSLMALYGRLHSGVTSMLPGADETDLDTFLSQNLDDATPKAVAPSVMPQGPQMPNPAAGAATPPGGPSPAVGPRPFSLLTPRTDAGAPVSARPSLAGPSPAAVMPPPGASGPTASGTVAPGATSPPITPPAPVANRPPSLAGPRLTPTGPPAKNRKLSIIKPPPADVAPQPGPMFTGASGDVGGGGVSPANDASGPARETPQLGTGTTTPGGGKQVSRANLTRFAVSTRRTPEQAETYAKSHGWTIIE